MKSLTFLSLASLLCLVQKAWSQNEDTIAIPPDGASCWVNTTLIFEHLSNATPFSSNTYVLCPNTDYNIGFTNSDGVCCEDGDFPLVARTNTKFQCGEDGSSANNCRLVGGANQFLMISVVFQEAEATNVVTQGITFTGAGLTTMTPSLAGDFTFIDCIFEVRALRVNSRSSCASVNWSGVGSYTPPSHRTIRILELLSLFMSL